MSLLTDYLWLIQARLVVNQILSYHIIQLFLFLFIRSDQTIIDQYCPSFLKKDETVCKPQRYRHYNGLCNNLERPYWGAALTAFRRLLPADYADGMWTIEALKNRRFSKEPRSQQVLARRALPLLATLCRQLVAYRPFITTIWAITTTQSLFSSSLGVKQSTTTWHSQPTPKVNEIRWWISENRNQIELIHNYNCIILWWLRSCNGYGSDVLWHSVQQTSRRVLAHWDSGRRSFLRSIPSPLHGICPLSVVSQTRL